MNSSQKVFLGVYDLWYQSWWHHAWFYAVVGLFFCGGIAWFVWLKCRRKLTLSCDQEALQELYRLSSQTIISPEILHDAYFKLTMIMKNYFAARYQIVLKDKTDVQIVSMLHGIVSQNVLSLMQEFFDRSFRIKFAYDVVLETTLFQDIKMLQAVIIETSKQHQITGKS
jgi:hypothetical protein